MTKPFLNPRVNYYFEIYSAPNGISFLQHNSDGSQPITIFNSLDKSVEFFGDLDIPNHYNKTELNSLLSNINPSDDYNKTEMDFIVSYIDSNNYYTKTEIHDLGNELSTLILNTYTKTEIDTQLTDYMTTLSITETLINNYASLTLLGDSLR